jgi:hypothetical protein
LSQDVAAPAAALRAALARARSAVAAPAAALRERAATLERMHAAAAVLGAARRRAAAVERVRSVAAGGSDVLALARAVADADAVAAEVDVDWSAAPAAWEGGDEVEAARESARRAARSALAAALAARATADAGDAALACHWLGDLPAATRAVLADAAMDAAARLAPAGRAGVGSDAAAAAADAALAGLADGAALAGRLAAALAARRDPATGQRLASVGVDPAAAWWRDAAPRAFAAALPAAGPLAAAYPRLAASFDAALARAPPGTPPPPPGAAAACLAPPRRAWAAAARARCADAAAAAFGGAPRSPVPASADVQRLVARLHDVLTDADAAAGAGGRGGQAADDAAALAGTAAAAGVAAAANRAAAMAATGPETRRTDGPASQGAARNIALSSAAAELARSLAALAPRAPPAAAPALAPALDALQAAAADIVLPLFAQAAAHAEAAAGKVGKGVGAGSRDYSSATPAPTIAAPAAWATDVASVLAHFRGEYLARFAPALPAPAAPRGAADTAPATAPAALAARLAARVALVVLRRALLLRRVSPGGAVALAGDLAAVDAALAGDAGAPRSPPPGHPCAGLRALRKLLFVADADLGGPGAAASLAALAPGERVLFLLSRAPACVPPLAPPPDSGSVDLWTWLDGAPPAEVAAAARAAVAAAGSAPSLEAGWDAALGPALAHAVAAAASGGGPEA